jgi:hypothetical protein
VGVRADHAVLRPATNRAAVLLIETDPKSLIGPTAAIEVRLQVPALILVSADTELNAAATSEGLTVEDPNTHP